MKAKLSAALCCLGLASPVLAQSQVTIYGLLDAGISRVSNQNGATVTKMDDGIYAPSLLGFRGSEDLGGGIQALFHLQTQLALGTGGIIPNSTQFWRQSHVGLSFRDVGTVTLGNQLDFMGEFAPALNDPGLIAGSLYAFSGGPFSKLGIPQNVTGGLDWDRTAGVRAAGTAKFQSAAFAGFSFGAMYGAPEGGANNRTVSASVKYDAGPLGLGAAFTEVAYPVAGGADVTIRNLGLGGHYVFGPVIANALLTSAENLQTNAKVRQIRVGAKWDFAAPWSLAGALSYAKGNAQLDNNHATQATATLAYAFSKRTLAYAQGVYQKTNATAKAHIMGVMDPAGASSTNTQSILRIGVHTAF